MYKKIETKIDEIDIKKEMVDRKLPLLIDIADKSAFNFKYDLNTESFKVFEEHKINKVLDLLKRNAQYIDQSVYPQRLFQTDEGIEHISYGIDFKEHSNNKGNLENLLPEEKKEQIVKELTSILEIEKFVIDTKEIVDILISTPDINSFIPSGEPTFYCAFMILHSHDDVLSYNGKTYDEFSYQYLGMVYNLKLYDENDEEIKPMRNEQVILGDVIKLKLNEFNEINYFDEHVDLNEIKLLSEENKRKTLSYMIIESIEYDLITADKDSSKINENEFKGLIEENFEKISTEFILPCADGVTYINNKEEIANE